MNTLQNLFDSFSQIYSPNTPKQLAKRCLNEGTKDFTKNEVTWSLNDYSLVIETNNSEFNIWLTNGNDLLIHKTGDIFKTELETKFYDYDGEMNREVAIPISEWDNYEKELFIKEKLGL